MSGLVTLEVVQGTDWATQITWDDASGNGVPFTLPTMDIRQDMNSSATRLARLDTITSTSQGTITITAPGTMLLTLPAAVTGTFPTGQAYWDIYVTTQSNQRARLLFGNIAIKPQITAAS